MHVPKELNFRARLFFMLSSLKKTGFNYKVIQETHVIPRIKAMEISIDSAQVGSWMTSIIHHLQSGELSLNELEAK